MRRVEIKHNIGAVFVLLLFAVFAGSILMVLLFGASAYERIVSSGQAAYDERTAVQYIAAKIRYNDEADSVYVGSFSSKDDAEADDIDTLYLKLQTEEDAYYTKIYYYDGYLREILCAEDGGLSPEDGNEILAVKGLQMSMEKNLVKIQVENQDGTYSSICLSVRSSQEGKQ